MNHRRSSRGLSHSQRSGGPSGGHWRQSIKEQGQNKSNAQGTDVYPSQRSGVPTGRQWRQSNKERWQNESKVPVAEVEEEDQKPGPQVKETVPRGVCQTMCPTQELWDREKQNRLHRFEMVLGTEKDRRPRGDPLRAVKEYSRPAAGKDATNPPDLRPPAVLLKTVCYLIDDIATSPNLQPWTEVYNFVFDRLRSVKQDMIIQRVSGLDCVAILERAVRFLIYASYCLCGEPLRLYDPSINDTHLQEYLSWLLDCYKTGTEPYPNQEEFHALDLLYNLGSGRAMQHILEVPKQHRSTPSITLALSINQAFLERNPLRLLRLAQKLNFLQTCALHRHLVKCRRDLLLIYSHGYSSRNCRFPLHRLSKLLSLDISLTSQLCQVYGLEVSQDKQVIFSKAAFNEPEQGKLHCKLYHSIVADKQKGLTIGNIIHGNAFV
ncbi:SAC3 domain-containing protein 1 [Cololabis saira]|uniref:SAC3 domain-containing protein 1 n=1 Tax=Cololabis saira TaxID=129043 RepID=UPI002AD40BA6|nr:SAC3 domain-containing protein 1 [Cololabis saira]